MPREPLEMEERVGEGYSHAKGQGNLKKKTEEGMRHLLHTATNRFPTAPAISPSVALF